MGSKQRAAATPAAVFEHPFQPLRFVVESLSAGWAHGARPRRLGRLPGIERRNRRI
jgi:hypothetical protein